VTPVVRWLHGEEKLQRALEDLLLAEAADDAGLEWQREQVGRRRTTRVQLANGEHLFLKQTFGAGHRHATRKRVKNALGLAAAEREARALKRLRADDVAVPELRALAVLKNGDRLLATRALTGRNLLEELAAPECDRNALLGQVGALIRRLHATGTIHRDLHGGNILVTADGPVLLDLASARRSRRSAARMRDLGFLDYSLTALLSTAARVRLAAAALGLSQPFDAAARRALGAVATASDARARAHAASRSRRALVPGRLVARLRLDRAAGLRLREVDPDALQRTLAQLTEHTAPGSWVELKSDRRARVRAGSSELGAIVVKEYRARGPAHRFADAFRGSPARRDWQAAHGLAARGIAAARPLAYLERRRFGLPAESTTVFRDVRPGEPADACPPAHASPNEVVDALRRLVTQLHRHGVVHGDLKASHVFLARDGDQLTTCLIDLSGVQFYARLSEADRIRALAELNASLPDSVPDAARCSAFARYAAVLPFARGSDAALRSVVAASLEREHRWTGRHCARARS